MNEMRYKIYVKTRGQYQAYGYANNCLPITRRRVEEEVFNCEDVVIIDMLTGEVV